MGCVLLPGCTLERGGYVKKQSRKDSRGRVLQSGEYERKNGYEYRYTQSGIRKSVYADSLQELRTIKKEIQDDIAKGIDTISGDVSLNELFEKYIDIKSGILKQSTLNSNKCLWNNHVKDVIGKKKIRDIKRTDVQCFYVFLQRHKKLKKGSIRVIHNMIYGTLEMAIDDDILPKNPARRCLKDVPEDKTEKQPLTIEQANSLLEFCKDSIYNIYIPFLVITYGTGLRVAEACGLCWEDIDMENRLIYVKRQLRYGNINGKGYIPYIDTPKTEAGQRVIPMTESVYHAFYEQRKMNFMLGRRCDVEVDGYSNFVFISRNNTPYKPCLVEGFVRNIEKAYNKAHSDNPLPHLTPHVLRHTFCTIYASKQMEIKALQIAMGHKDIRTTMDIYNHGSIERTKAEFTRLGDIVNY